MTLHDGPRPAGTPAWVDLTVADLAASQRFYAATLGWTFEGGGDEASEIVYLQALLDGRRVAGLATVPEAWGRPEPRWTTYLATDDLDAAVTAAPAAGGRVLEEPQAAGASGRLAVLADPTGAVVGLWEAGTHAGAQVTDVPGAMVWNEVLTDDLDRARDFYVALAGWTLTDISGPGFRYLTFEVDGRTAGGIGELEEVMTVGRVPQWLVYFATDDVDDAVARAVAHGGTARREPWDSPYGRLAVLGGPDGEIFALMDPAEESAETAAGTGTA